MKAKQEVIILGTVFFVGLLLPSSSGSQWGTDYNATKTENRHVVLIHGSFHGAWCWYKVTTLLQKKGYTVGALDLTSHGINKAVADNVTSIAQYVQPAVEYLDRITGKVVLVGHSLGGTSISYLMEKYGTEKITKAVFIASTMPKNNQSFLGATIVGLTTYPPEAQPFHYGNGLDNPPTSISFNLSYGRRLFYGSSPEEDVVLANTLLVPTPFAVVNETLHLTPARYGKVRRYYVVTEKDTLVNSTVQELILAQNPPERVFRLKNSDHSAFFSAPYALTKVIQIVDSL